MPKCNRLFLPLLMVSACTTVGPDFETPAAPPTSGYAMEGDMTYPDGIALESGDALPVEWWKVLQSPEIDRLVELALDNSPTLDLAEATLARARYAESAQRGESGPQANASGNFGRERINTAAFGIKGFPSPTINLYSIGSAVSFDPDLFGKQERQLENAAARTEAEASRADATYLTLTGQVVTTAIQLASLRSQLDELDNIIEGDRRTRDMIQRGVDAGGEPKSAINTAEAQLAEDEARRPPLLYEVDAARHALALLVGKAPADWTAPEIDLSDVVLPKDVPVRLPSELVRRRPDILAAEADLHSATAAIGVAEANLYPDISLDASFALTTLAPEDVFKYESSGWSVGPSATMPLFNGGSLKARRQMAVEDAKAADATYRQTVLKAFVQVADLFSAIAKDQSLIVAQTRASDIAEENVRLASIGYENGAQPLLTVIDAQRQAQRARLALVDAQAQLRKDVVALYLAGGYVEPRREAVVQPAAAPHRKPGLLRWPWAHGSSDPA